MAEEAQRTSLQATLASNLNIQKIDDATFRLVRWGDKQGVLDITGTEAHGGRDYLPAMFDDFLCDPKRRCYVCELNDVIISFVMILVVDEGTAAIIEGRRTVKEYRGLDINKRLTQFAMRQTKEKFPGVKRVLFTSDYDGFLADPDFKMKRGEILLNTSGISEIQRLLDSLNTGDALGKQMDMTKKISKHDVAALLLTSEKRDLLFPKNIVTNWVPYSVNESNLDNIVDGKVIFANDSTGSLSFATVCHARHCIAYYIDIHVIISCSHGDDINGHAQNMLIDNVIGHFLAHAHYVSKWQTDRPVCFILMFNDGIDPLSMQEKCQKLGFRICSDSPALEVLIERPVEKYLE